MHGGPVRILTAPAEPDPVGLRSGTSLNNRMSVWYFFSPFSPLRNVRTLSQGTTSLLDDKLSATLQHDAQQTVRQGTRCVWSSSSSSSSLFGAIFQADSQRRELPFLDPSHRRSTFCSGGFRSWGSDPPDSFRPGAHLKNERKRPRHATAFGSSFSR